MWQQAECWTSLLDNICRDQPPVALEISTELPVSVLVLLLYSLLS